jgi:hypothetical protein
MRELQRSNNLILIAVILIVLVIAMMLTQPKFFELTDEQRADIYTELGNNWHKIELQAFSINTPTDFKFIKQQGIDSYVGLIANESDTLTFDYGWYSNGLKDRKYQRSYDTINGVPAITAFSTSGELGIHFPNVVGDDKLTLYSATIPKEIALEIFRTVKFPGHFGRTSEQLGQNNAVGFTAGEQIFESNCGACHQLHQIVIGPSLNGVIERKGIDWFMNWITNPKELIETNEEAARLFEDYGRTEHLAYPFEEQELQLLIEYIKQN